MVMGYRNWAAARQLWMMAKQRGLLKRRSPSSTLKVQNRTLPCGWYFIGFAMGIGSAVGE